VYAVLRAVWFVMDADVTGLLLMTPDMVPYARAWILANILEGLDRLPDS
jgi:hypothetical protein